ncbi:uncharacterized protein LOC141715252 [Apium graveolens]|uniref:uncharacterized protein LOC141715252 n=1 Tax=Apium graveolens TaxID=4045 RepID=UPI003D7AB2AA
MKVKGGETNKQVKQKYIPLKKRLRLFIYLLIKVDKDKQTALHHAARSGHIEVVEILIDAARRIWPSSATTDDPSNSPSHFEDFLRRADYKGNTALHEAVRSGAVATVERLVNADPNDRHTQNWDGETPMYDAVQRRHYDIVKMMCKTCTAPSLDGPKGHSALHAAIEEFYNESTDKDRFMVLMDSAKRSSLLQNGPDNYFKSLFDRVDHQNRTLLSLAVLTNNLDVVKLILEEDPAYEHPTTSKDSDLKSLICTASREGYKDVVKILLEIYGKHGRRHCHVLLIEAIEEGHKDYNLQFCDFERAGGLKLENVSFIFTLSELVYSLLEYDKHLAAYNKTGTSGWTALHYAAFYKFDQIIEDIISAQKDVGYSLSNKEPPLILAVQKGFISTAVLLMNLLPDTSNVYTNRQSRRNILHIAVLENNKEMIHTILEHCPRSRIDKILNGQDDEDGNTPLHLLIEQGCFVPELIKHSSVDMMARNKNNQTPSDMLHSHEEVKADQAKIKYLLDDSLATRQSWRINIGRRWSNSKKPGDTTKRLLKDIKFRATMNLIKKEELQEWKEKIKPYRERTTTQIIVTALITTVTFTVGFTMPGGYHQSGEPEEGLVLLSKKKVFEVFMVSDAIALALSITSLFIYFISSVYDDPHQVSKFDIASIVLNIVSVIAMILTFTAGVYVVLSHSPGLALIVCMICSIFFLSLVVLLIKMMYDCKKSRKINV